MFTLRKVNWGDRRGSPENFAGYRWFESISLQRGVTCELDFLDDAPCHIAVFADRETTQGHGLGRYTMSEMIEYSAVAAVHTLWLAARAEGIGMGWVSILDPRTITAILDVPANWKLIGYFCLGFPEAEDDVPVLQRLRWEERRPAASFLLRR